MNNEILINVTPRETRIAVVEDGILQEVHIERTNRRGLVGNIYKGRVSRVLPGMQAAFLDIGLERTAFLHISDMLRKFDDTDVNQATVITESISNLLREGQEILVQVIKDPIGSKGARLTTQIALPSRYLIFMPQVAHLGVSRRIEDESERERLKAIFTEDMALRPEASKTDGYIIRTAAEGVSAKHILEDKLFLEKLWGEIKVKSNKVAPGLLVHEDLPLVLRTIRSLLISQVERIRVDAQETYEQIVDFSKRFIPAIVEQVEHYTGERLLFDLFNIEEELQKALQQKVQLKSGGYLIIDQTEAMTTIDVNTGAFVGHRNQDETTFKTNLEAAFAIARELRLRNIGGIIILDFIDMFNEEHKREVVSALETALSRDHTKITISQVSALGLVEITRKRTRESLTQLLCDVCPTCSGRGHLKSVETVCYEIFRDLLRESRMFKVQSYLVLASQPVIDRLLDEESPVLAELEASIGKPIKLQVETSYNQEQYDVILI